MDMKYYFGIQNSQIGPLDKSEIEGRIKEGSITKGTLAWCEGMDGWKPLSQVPELMAAFGAILTQGSVPPPLPTGQGAPPLPGSEIKNASSGAGNLNDQAYRFVTWCYRPWRGKVSPLRKWVDADPKRRAVPVAAGTIAMMVLIVFLAISSFSGHQDTGEQGISSQTQSMQQGMGTPSLTDIRERQRIWQDAHRYSQDVIDDAYKYRRDSQDRRDETYRRGTYDWYGKGKD